MNLASSQDQSHEPACIRRVEWRVSRRGRRRYRQATNVADGVGSHTLAGRGTADILSAPQIGPGFWMVPGIWSWLLDWMRGSGRGGWTCTRVQDQRP